MNAATVSRFGSTKLPTECPARMRVASVCACCLEPRKVTYFVTRLPVAGSRPASNFRRHDFLPRRVRLLTFSLLLCNEAAAFDGEVARVPDFSVGARA